MRVIVAARRGLELRCAYCHADLGSEERRCSSCRTVLHQDCWDLAGICPTLGCVPRVRVVQVLERQRGASRFHFGVWLMTFGGVSFALTQVVPAFAKMFRETGLCLPAPTEILVAVSEFSCTWLGLATLLAIGVASCVAYARRRESPWVRRAFTTLTWLGLAFVPFALVSLFLPLVQNVTRL